MPGGDMLKRFYMTGISTLASACIPNKGKFIGHRKKKQNNNNKKKNRQKCINKLLFYKKKEKNIYQHIKQILRSPTDFLKNI